MGFGIWHPWCSGLWCFSDSVWFGGIPFFQSLRYRWSLEKIVVIITVLRIRKKKCRVVEHRLQASELILRDAIFGNPFIAGTKKSASLKLVERRNSRDLAQRLADPILLMNCYDAFPSIEQLWL